MTVHPTLLTRYRTLLEHHRTILPPGELTAITQLERLDPCEVLSLACELGEERAAEVLRQKLHLVGTVDTHKPAVVEGGAMKRLVLPIAPVPAPRQSQRDRWKKRPVVVRYRAFRDAVALLTAKERIPKSGLTVTFYVPMPASWSKKKRAAMEGQPHEQKPDVDNFGKGLLDSLWPEDDSAVWDVRFRKLWDVTGRIEIEWDGAA